MLYIFLGIIVTNLIFIPFWYIGKKRQTLKMWDFLIPSLPVVVWFLPFVYKLGSGSLANFVELPIIVMVLMVVWGGKLVLCKRNPKYSNYFSTSLLLLGVLLPILLRLLMPMIPE